MALTLAVAVAAGSLLDVRVMSFAGQFILIARGPDSDHIKL